MYDLYISARNRDKRRRVHMFDLTWEELFGVRKNPGMILMTLTQHHTDVLNEVTQ